MLCMTIALLQRALVATSGPNTVYTGSATTAAGAHDMLVLRGCRSSACGQASCPVGCLGYGHAVCSFCSLLQAYKSRHCSCYRAADAADILAKRRVASYGMPHVPSGPFETAMSQESSFRGTDPTSVASPGVGVTRKPALSRATRYQSRKALREISGPCERDAAR